MMVFVCSTCFGDVFRVTFIANPVSIVLCIHVILPMQFYKDYRFRLVWWVLLILYWLLQRLTYPIMKFFHVTMISCKMTLAGFVKYRMLGPADVVGFPILQPLAKVSDHQLRHSLLIFSLQTFFKIHEPFGVSAMFFFSPPPKLLCS